MLSKNISKPIQFWFHSREFIFSSESRRSFEVVTWKLFMRFYLRQRIKYPFVKHRKAFILIAAPLCKDCWFFCWVKSYLETNWPFLDIKNLRNWCRQSLNENLKEIISSSKIRWNIFPRLQFPKKIPHQLTSTVSQVAWVAQMVQNQNLERNCYSLHFFLSIKKTRESNFRKRNNFFRFVGKKIKFFFLVVFLLNHKRE